MAKTTGTVFYLDRQDLYETTKPYFCYIPPEQLQRAPVTNQKYVPFDVPMTDIRGQEHAFTLDSTGFEVADHPLKAKYTFERLLEDGSLVREYEHEIEQFLMQKLRAKKVVVFDEEVRRNRSYCPVKLPSPRLTLGSFTQLRKRNPEFPHTSGKRSSLEQPVRGVHVGESASHAFHFPQRQAIVKCDVELASPALDSSPASAVERAVWICNTPELRHLLEGRIQIIK